MTDLEKANRAKFVSFLGKLPKLINDGQNYEQCMSILLKECDWCYITSDEQNMLTKIFNYLTK